MAEFSVSDTGDPLILTCLPKNNREILIDASAITFTDHYIYEPRWAERVLNVINDVTR